MSDTPNNPAEPTENQGGGTNPAPNITTESPLPPVEEEAVKAAEPADNQGGG